MIRQLVGDCRVTLATLPEGSVQSVITSPPYFGLRAYIADGHPAKPFEIGLEPTPELFIEHIVEVFRQVKRVLRDDGCLLVNMGDSYAGSGKGPSNSIQGDASQIGPSARKARGMNNLESTPTAWIPVGSGYKAKDLMMMPARVAMALQADGWWLRSMMPWLKRSAMPESVTDRPASSVEYWFLLTKSARYFWDAEAVRHPATMKPQNRFTVREDHPKGDAGRPAHRRPEGATDPGNRSMRNGDLFFASWQGLLLDEDDAPQAMVVNPAGFAGAHFATFPPKLVEPLIKATTSEKGQCPECGAPWVRVTERTGGPPPGDHRKRDDMVHTAYSDGAHPDGVLTGGSLSAVYAKYGYPEVTTTGWRASCEHADLTPVPQTICDPFAGAGTVLLVADRLGRNAIGCELSDSYASLATDRLTGDAPMFVELSA